MRNYSRDELISKYKEFLMPSINFSFKEPICVEKENTELYEKVKNQIDEILAKYF